MTGAVLFAKNLDQVATFYSVMLGLTEANRADDHIVLESPGFQLVVHRVTVDEAAPTHIHTPPVRRTRAAFTPVFFVPSISGLRAVVEKHGGALDPIDQQWSFNGATVCDGLDPEGNVIQLREQTETTRA